jgi:hypothetical protein
MTVRRRLSTNRNSYETDSYINSISSEFTNNGRTVVWSVTTNLAAGTKLGVEVHSADLADYYLYPTFDALGTSDYFDTYSGKNPGWPSAKGFFNLGYTTSGNGTFGNVDVGADGNFTMTTNLTDYDNFNRISANTSIYLAVTRPSGTYGELRKVLSTSSNVYITQETGMSISGGTGVTTILSALDGSAEPAANGWLNSAVSGWSGRRVTEVTSVGTTTLTVSTGDLAQYSSTANVYIHAIAGGGGGALGSDVSSPGGGGGAGAYVYRVLTRDSENIINLVDNSNISVIVGAGGSSAVGSNVEATNSSITYETVISGNISVSLLRGGMGYSGFPGDEDGGSGSGADWKDGVPGTGIGTSPSDGDDPAGHDGGGEDVPGGASLRSAGGGGGVYSDADDATTNTGGDGGQGIIGTAYTGSSTYGLPSNFDNINISGLPLANVFIGEGGGGGGLTPGVPKNAIGVPGAHQSGGTGGTGSANATTVVANTGSGGGGGRYDTTGAGSVYYPGSTGADGSFAISYKAAWRKFTSSL